MAIHKKTVAAFEEWVSDPANIDDVLDRVMGGSKLHQVCVEIKRPYTLLYPYLHGNPELKVRYEAALAARAEMLMHDRLGIAEAQRVKKRKTPADVMATRLACDVMESTAKSWNRARYGERFQMERLPEAPGDVGLLGFASELLKLVASREPRVVEEREALPAPKGDGLLKE